ncbi:MAG: hypothetical protein AAGA72_00415 [Pseudomonadota bacterium]
MKDTKTSFDEGRYPFTYILNIPAGGRIKAAEVKETLSDIVSSEGIDALILSQYTQNSGGGVTAIGLGFTQEAHYGRVMDRLDDAIYRRNKDLIHWDADAGQHYLGLYRGQIMRDDATSRSDRRAWGRAIERTIEQCDAKRFQALAELERERCSDAAPEGLPRPGDLS